MNQILNTNKKREKLKKVFIIQFRISIIFIIFGIIYIIKNIRDKEKENNISNIISLNAKLNSVFSSNYYNNISNENNSLYIGKIICNKINLEYFIYNEYSYDNLKILPCKFSGGTFGEDGNICIMGHNYFDDRFFSNIDKLGIGDIIKIEKLDGEIYEYSVYKKYEIDEKDIEEATKSKAIQEITLCTCTFNKEKRYIVRARKV